MAGAGEIVLDYDGAAALDLSERSLRVSLSMLATDGGMAEHIRRMPRYARTSTVSTTRRIK
jgi:hypothetical protein